MKSTSPTPRPNASSPFGFRPSHFLRISALGSRTLALALLLPAPAKAAEPTPPSKPNILFIAVDDLRPELACYGNPIIKSPNIDRIAKAGVVFNRAYCQQAVCSPTRSSLLTGTRPDTTKVWDLKTHFRKALPDVVTLPQHFKNNGYFVQGMGKIYHSGYNDPPSWSVPWTNPKVEAYGSAENKDLVKKRRQKAIAEGKNEAGVMQVARAAAYEGAPVPDNTFHDGALAEMAVTALREIKEKKQPFFLAVGFIRPHLPFVSPKKYWDLYDPAKIPLAPNPYRPKRAPEYAILEGGELRSYTDIPHGHLPDDLARKLKHGYYAAVSYMDAQVGRVLDELERLGLRDNTIIVLWGDHGWKLGEHDAWCKHSNVENDTWVPLLLSVPGMKNAGKHTDALVEFVDIYPTLADLAGLPLPSHLEGASARPLLDDLSRAWKPAVFSQYPRPVAGKQLMGYSMRTDRYRFTAWLQRNDHSKAEAVELYDHQNDPQENVNIANQPENAALVKELTAKLKAGWKAALPGRP
jgi:iduronate 2-sulfatase